MSAGEEIEVAQLSQEIDAVPRDPPFHEKFRELHATQDSAIYDNELTVFFNPNNADTYYRISSEAVVDLKEER